MVQQSNIMTYSTIQHQNSNRSRGERARINSRRRSLGLDPVDFESSPFISHQIVRDPVEGTSLRTGYSPALLRALLRAYRSKYEPHVGAKQTARLLAHA